MKRSPRWWLLILLAAFAFRLFRLGASSLWYDETVSLYLARLDLVSLTRHTAGDIHPPLYYYILHFWGQFAGWSEFSAAFLSLFFGVLLIGITYRVARVWFNLRVAFVSAFLVAISPNDLWYSQEVRMYTLGAVLGLASVHFMARMLQMADGRWRMAEDKTQQAAKSAPRVSGFTSLVMRDLRHHSSLIVYAFVSVLGLYTLYYFVFLLVFENVVAFLWLFRKSEFAIRRIKLRITNYELRTWLLSQLAILALYLPWLPIAFHQATDPPVPPWRAFIPLPNALLEAFSALALGQSVEPAEVWWVLALVAAVIGVALTKDERGERKEERKTEFALRITPWFLFAYTFIPLALIYALSLWKPLYHVRYTFIYSPAFYILIAVGLGRIADGEWRIAKGELRIANYILRITQFAILSILTIASAYSAFNFWFSPRNADDDLRGAARYLSERWRPGDAILLNAGYTYPAFLYYSDVPIAWRGRLPLYPPENISSGTIQRLVDIRGAIVLQTGTIGGAANLGWGSPESDFYATTEGETRAALDRVFAFHPRVWMLRLYDTVVDPDGVIRDYLATRGRIIDDRVFAGEANARVQGFLTTRAPLTELPSSLIRRELVLSNRIVLRGFETIDATARAGTALDIVLYWQAREPLNVDARVFIGLFAEDGRVVASSEETPVGNALGTSRWSSGEIYREPARLLIPANISPGNYQLRITLFDPFTHEAYSAEPSEWVVEKTQMKLIDVRVEK